MHELMTGFFKKKRKEPKENEKQPLGTEPEAALETPSAEKPEGKKKKPLFSFKKKPPGGQEGDVREKPPKKPLFVFGKKSKKSQEPEAQQQKKKKHTFGGSRYSPVGLDLGRSSISAVRLQYQDAGSKVVTAALDQLPEGVISEGEVNDVDALGQALKSFWRTYKIRGRKVALGLASQKIVVRTLDFPVLEKKELRKAIEYQAQDYIPIPIEDAVFDFHVIRRFTDNDGIEKQKVLVVAAQKAMVMNYIDAVKKAKLTIDGIDLQAFAMLRSFSPHSFLDEGTPSGHAVAIVHIASDVTNMVIEANGEPQFTRITSFGGDDFTRAVQEQLGVPFMEAETMKTQIGLPEPGNASPGADASPSEGGPLTDGGSPTDKGQDGDDSADDGLPPQGGDFPEGPMRPAGDDGESNGDDKDEQAGAGEGADDDGKELLWPEDSDSALDEEKEIEATVHRALEITTDSFADELRRSLDYYISQDESLPISRLLLSGGGALLPNLDRQLSQLFPFPVELGDPLVRITGNKSRLSDDELKALAPRLAIAIGLALEDED
ncbi:competence protein A [bacterium BMS3Abin01]|nr:competence protein A [bacterium BMS3Abin01]